ncbi:hypothetical protein PHYPSEUDO_010431 [Phytophthora pseudosyringae]|uniref:Myb-like DNA-binding protein n=1 Tax=Phytophthora pseudosyringae TaxID=221518 RepID=A0A8T1VAU4_9STRA|nr:hypothetical protein PHYPSEUDO_010431 [Phytophthora pseudosyringae]
MFPGIDRPAWKHPACPDRASPPPQSQTGWFPLQDAEQHHQASQSGWLQDATGSPSQEQRAYDSSPIYAPTPPYVWTGEPPSQARAAHFLPSPTYPRPLILSDSELYDRAQEQHDQKPQTILRRNKQIAIGRWNSEEHQWFLKGLEMFQGPAWGEIARLIGTRTSTQVRTHAQKFFTKLARLNQTMPYFEVQIQKERARLVAQGASVTPTAQSAPLSATLSPRKRLASAGSSPRQTHKRLKEETVAASPTYAAAAQTRYPQEAYDVKPRVFTGGFSTAVSPSESKEWAQQWTPDDARQWPLASPTSAAASIQLTQMQMAEVGQQTSPTAAPDAESLPSMNKMLFRSSTAA